MTQTPIRFASFNASLNRNSAGQLITDLSTPNNTQAQNVAEIIQRTNPDVVLINEFDFYEDGQAAELFRQNYLQVSQNGAAPVDYPYFYVAPSNTGVPSGFDLDNNGTVGGPNDALGFGFFPGQFGMALFSKYPIDFDNVRTFQEFLWKDMPGALLPDDPTTPAPNDFYSPEELEIFRLSSKSHWDVPINVNGEIVHVLASHPTPPVFDGPEDRNGTRNFDEIRFWKDYITPGQGDYIYDDNGGTGGLTPGARFVIMGDQNSDPLDGDSIPGAIQQLLGNPLVNTSTTPSSAGGPAAAQRQGGANTTHQSDPAFDTADFADTAPGNLRADYVLPSSNLGIAGAGVFWPTPDDPLFRLVGDFDPTIPGGFPSSDHRLVYADVVTPGIARNSVSDIDFLGEVTFPTSFQFEGTTVGGLSGIAYDHENGVYYSISDDRSPDARFYTLDINLSDGSLDDGGVSFLDFTTLLDANGNPFPNLSLDPEGIALTDDGTVYISSEGEVNPAQGRVFNPFVREFNLATGRQVSSLPIPSKFLPNPGVSGIRNNAAFESLTITPNQRYLFTATENALVQDGPAASLTDESPSRIIQYDLVTGKPVKEFVYFTDPVAAEPDPAGSFSTNGLVELLAIDNTGTLLALERSFSTGVGNSIKLYQVQTQGAVDVSSLNSVDGLEPDPAVEKKLLLDFADLGITLDNIEGITLGPKLADGRQSLIVVSDNNFSATQTTQILAFAIDIDTTPAAAPTVETPPVLDIAPEDRREGQQIGDADDPAIYVHPTDSSKSFVIGFFKEGGLSVYDLNGNRLQTIQPNGVSYNNVDLIYGFNLGGRSVDLAIASDRANDTVALFRVDPNSRRLIGISGDLPASIFGVDDGEQTAYGLASYTSPITGKSYVFVSQASGNQIAQIELVAQGKERINAKVVRTFEVPIPDGLELEDAQVEGMVVDRERGILYVGQEQFGIYKFSAEPNGSTEPVLVDSIANGNLQPDIEGLTIYYGADGKGYLIASSQGDNTFAVYSRDTTEYLGSFAVGSSNGIDSAEESDGADVINVPLGPQFPFGMLVVQDGNNDPQTVINDDGEIENASGNFKFVPWENVANSFFDTLDIDTTSYNPRDPVFSTGSSNADLLRGTNTNNRIAAAAGNDFVNGLDGNDTLRGGEGNDLIWGGKGNDHISGDTGSDRLLGQSGNDTLLGGAGDDLLDGGSGNDTLRGGVGNDTITGGSGNDVFVLAAGEGTDVITDFRGDDRIGLAAGLSFGQLTITQGSGSNSRDTIISVAGEELAVLTGVQANTLSSDSFVLA
jgi:3-phytase